MEWHRLEPDVIAFLQPIAKDRLPFRLSIINSTLSHIIPQIRDGPSLLDYVVRCKPINDLMLLKTKNFSGAHISKHKKTILTFVDEWEKSYNRYVDDLVKQELKLQAHQTISPKLAIASIFTCTFCGQLSTGQFLKSHFCERSSAAIIEQYSMTTPGKKMLMDACLTFKEGEFWMPRPQGLPTHFKSLACRLVSIVSEYGLNPIEATTEEMDRASVRLQCATCKMQSVLSQTMNWREAIAHAAEFHTEPDSVVRWTHVRREGLYPLD
ncbi:hypothetical protein BDY19DRAFT_275638 [Irpex rosettiformis]|uniref:Uncharacterized protein n=1 Tax=Irpex rosettiformis TaxID=378272 RepID=A0ACB8UHL7_9APHY|nr:hypothetical protein BDY19DRAFT_275638 [Irpex rosettiformis]